MIALQDLHWAAGFLEGEGTFGKLRTLISAAQANQSFEPLYKLRQLFGGTITDRKLSTWPNSTPQQVWTLYGSGARGLMMTIYALMSPRRCAQIRASLTRWRHHKLNGGKTHCPRGHPYEGVNIVWYRRRNGNLNRICRICQRKCGSAAQRRRRQKAKQLG